MNEALRDAKDTERVELVAGDIGYFKLEEIGLLEGVQIETAIRDPHRNRRIDRLAAPTARALEAAQRTVSSDHGQAEAKS